MADYTRSKGWAGSIWPTNAKDAHPFGRIEPLLGPDELKSRFLSGIPLVSAGKDPVTGRRKEITDEELKDLIIGAVSRVEADTGLDVFPVQRVERHPFDRQLFEAFGYLKTQSQPVTSVERLAIALANGTEVYIVPIEWIDAGNFYRGQLNLVPGGVAFEGQTPSQSAGGVAFLSILGAQGWIPGYWSVHYTTGFPDAMIPRLVNDLIGIYTAIEVLGQLGATNRNASYSLGIDSMSQSMSTPGPQVYKERLDALEQQKVAIVNKLKAKAGTKLFVGTL